MAPTFKISFPLPGWRPNSSTNSTPGSHSSNRGDHDGSPMAYPGSKAERILGGAELDVSDMKKKTSRKEGKSLRKYPSFMSVTLADDENEAAPQEEGFPFPGMMTPNEAIQQGQQNLQRQGSSPLLGENRAFNPLTQTDCFSTSGSAKTRRAESSNALKAYFGKTKSPLLVSQQTSASSARDLALRKGMPQIASHSSHNVSASPQPFTASGLAHIRNISNDSKASQDSRLSAKSKIARTPRWRPSVTDPPTLYPEAPRPFHIAVSPPPALINSSLPSTMSPTAPQPKTFSRPRWWYRSKIEHEALPAADLSATQADMGGPDQRLSSIKVNVKKPKAGARNWFDGFDEDDGHMGTTDESPPILPGAQHQFLGKPQEPLSISEIMTQKPRPQPVTARKSSFSSKSGPPDRKLSFKLDSSPPMRTISGLSPANSMRSTNIMSRSLATKDGVYAPGNNGAAAVGVDVAMQSFLNLSSSDDDDDHSNVPSRESSHRGHRIRASVERADFGDDIMVGNAQRIQQVRPRPVVNKHNRCSSSRQSNSPEFVPPVPRIPNRPQLSPRDSSLRFRDTIESRSATTTDAESGSNNADTPLTTPLSARTSNSVYKRRSSFRGSKLMKVTSEEEKLLEAMREKRASIRATNYQKGFNEALSLQAGNDNIAPRPQTAGADGRHSFQRTSSLYSPHHSKQSSQGSISPPLPMLTSARYSGHKSKVSLASLGAGSRLSWSTDNLCLQEEKEAGLLYDNGSYPFPSVLEIVRSDIEPTTPSTGNLPPTPPPTMPGHGMTLAMGRSPVKGSLDNAAGREIVGHDRKRTASSGVVNLDGVEVAARMADEEREIVGWALDSY